ncbi:MAG: cytochrome c biogenesis protein ResB [Deltaproteobacteria bacterium]|nr:cytochrome c biogenesis protein ResB [Deltaproteobacteria bacterium]
MTTHTADVALDPEGVDFGAAPTSPVARFYAASWQLFISLRVTVVTLIVITAACFVGMFFDQTRTYDEHVAQWATTPWKLQLFTFFEMYDVFASWWFGLFVVILLVNVIACSVERLPKIWLDVWHPKPQLSDEQLRGIRHVWRGRIAEGDRAKAEGLIATVLGARAKTTTEGDRRFTFAEKQRWGRFGVYVVHTGLVMILVGGIINGKTKMDGLMMITEGTAMRLVRLRGPGNLPYVVDLGFSVRCDDFRLKTFTTGDVMEYESDLSVLDSRAPVNPVVTKKIEVNDPLEYSGYTFYQASYAPVSGDQLVQLDVGPRGGQRRTHSLAIGDKLTLDDGTTFVPVEVIEEFAGLGAAVRVQETSPTPAGPRTTSYVVFRSYPDFDREVRRGKFDVQFRGFDQQYATGIQVGRVPWVPFIFAGFVVLFVGMAMAFLMSHRRYWARLVPVGDGKLELVIAGAARRHQYAFADEFARLRTTVAAAFGEGERKADRARALREQRRIAKLGDNPKP